MKTNRFLLGDIRIIHLQLDVKVFDEKCICSKNICKKLLNLISIARFSCRFLYFYRPFA